MFQLINSKKSKSNTIPMVRMRCWMLEFSASYRYLLNLVTISCHFIFNAKTFFQDRSFYKFKFACNNLYDDTFLNVNYSANATTSHRMKAVVPEIMIITRRPWIYMVL
mmetsp:Transcript_23474/g.32843  ORF Transcript_23474/g.32843 Transcript_23474/m.32843 type:complete len:108 (+) Transcript_23474:198-521(+)